MEAGECDFCGLWWGESSGGISDGACPICRERYLSDDNRGRYMSEQRIGRDQRQLEADGAGLGDC